MIERLLAIRWPGWSYDAGLVSFAITTLAASWYLAPGLDPRWVYLPNGEQFGETCLLLTITGMPCPQCGMTRAFVHAARGAWGTAFLLNPAGLGLFLWIVAGGLLGAVRIGLRRPTWTVPHHIVIGWLLFWLVGLYLVPYGLRLFGINALP